MAELRLRLSVVIPAYNEEARILRTLERTVEYLDTTESRPYEVLVVSDGSTDRTEALVREFAQQHPQVKLLAYQPNRGKGHAVRYGILRAQGEWILFSDADLATPIEELEKLAPYLQQGYEVAIGSRPLRESQLVVRQPFYREWAGRAFNKAVQLLAVRGIHDTQCGFKTCRRHVAQETFPRLQFFKQAERPSGWKVSAYDVELLYIMEKAGYTIKEVVVEWQNRDVSVTKGQQSDLLRYVNESLEMAREIMRVKRNELRGMYDHV